MKTVKRLIGWIAACILISAALIVPAIEKFQRSELGQWHKAEAEVKAAREATNAWLRNEVRELARRKGIMPSPYDHHISLGTHDDGYSFAGIGIKDNAEVGYSGVSDRDGKLLLFEVEEIGPNR